jgi:hypothetical protein
MSFDLAVFYTTTPLTDADALKRYIGLCDANEVSKHIEPSPKVAAFVKDLTDRYPQIDDLPQDDFDDDCPWSIGFDLSEGHVIMCMIAGISDEVLDTIIELAKKHGLVCFCPQGSIIETAPPGLHITSGSIPVKSTSWWKFWR